MLTFHVEANTFDDLVAKAAFELGLIFQPAAVPAIPPAADTPPVAPTQPTEGAKAEQPAASSALAEAATIELAKRRGRPRKDRPVAAAAPSDGDGAVTQAAVVENTASAPAALPPNPAAEGVQPVDAPKDDPMSSGASAAALTAEATKETLRNMAQRFTDWGTTGGKKVIEIINKHGVEKISLLKDATQEQLAAIVAEAAAVKGDK